MCKIESIIVFKDVCQSLEGILSFLLNLLR